VLFPEYRRWPLGEFSRRGTRHRPTFGRTFKMRDAVRRPAWEAMHAPSLDGQRTSQARCQSPIPANHVTVGPGADRVRPPRRAVSCLLHQAVAFTSSTLRSY
jgi:hypothetical protein